MTGSPPFTHTPLTHTLHTHSPHIHPSHTLNINLHRQTERGEERKKRQEEKREDRRYFTGKKNEWKWKAETKASFLAVMTPHSLAPLPDWPEVTSVLKLILVFLLWDLWCMLGETWGRGGALGVQERPLSALHPQSLNIFSYFIYKRV